jgi:antitoxin VapB
MTVIRLTRETEALARRLAVARGISLEDAVAAAIEASAKAMATRTNNRVLSKDELIRRMEEISARSAARPLVDPRNPDELIGYGDFGLPR